MYKRFTNDCFWEADVIYYIQQHLRQGCVAQTIGRQASGLFIKYNREILLSLPTNKGFLAYFCGFYLDIVVKNLLYGLLDW